MRNKISSFLLIAGIIDILIMGVWINSNPSQTIVIYYAMLVGVVAVCLSMMIKR